MLGGSAAAAQPLPGKGRRDSGVQDPLGPSRQATEPLRRYIWRRNLAVSRGITATDGADRWRTAVSPSPKDASPGEESTRRRRRPAGASVTPKRQEVPPVTPAAVPTRFPPLLALPLLVVSMATGAAAQAPRQSGADTDITFAVGADLSFVKAAEDRGVRFKDVDGQVRPALDIFRDHGYDWIRLRVFHDPDELPNDLAYTIALAQAAKAKGYRFLLDYHFSDTWADPQHQITPAAWDTADIQMLSDSVYAYTRQTYRAFMDAGVTPDMVQIGNEVRVGMMWPLGKLPEHWDDFAALYDAALDGIDAARGREPRPLLMVHYDNGADTDAARGFFERFDSYGLPYDIIGFSYYPWWHGNLLELRDNFLSILANFPGKDVILVEVGYRPDVYRQQDRRPPYAEDAPGGPRKAFLEAVTQTLLGISSRRIKGVFWWEPATGCPSDFFREDCSPRPVLTVFDHYRRQ